MDAEVPVEGGDGELPAVGLVPGVPGALAGVEPAVVVDAAGVVGLAAVVVWVAGCVVVVAVGLSGVV